MGGWDFLWFGLGCVDLNLIKWWKLFKVLTRGNKEKGLTLQGLVIPQGGATAQHSNLPIPA